MSLAHVLTVKQPWADLIMAGAKAVENRSWQPPSTLPHWWRCPEGHGRIDSIRCERRHGAGGTREGVDDGPFPFRLGIHAAARVEWRDDRRALSRDLREAWREWDWSNGALGYAPLAVEPRTSVLLGFVTVTDCHHADECRVDRFAEPGDGPGGHVRRDWCSRWAEPGCFHWTLTDPEPLDEPVPMRGRQKLWRLPETVSV